MTREEERILEGEFGWARQVCMQIIVGLGDLFNASKLIEIDSAHVSGVSYKTLGDAPIDFLKALADEDMKVKVHSTINPQSFDSEYLVKKLPVTVRRKQELILEQFSRLGFEKSLTCTPYYLRRGLKGKHLAWSESSAVVYANSLLGAFTNREGGPSALAAAVIGKTADYGMHRPENRKPSVLVCIDSPLRSEIEYGALGIHLGKMLGDKVPLIRGLGKPDETCLKQLCAAVGASGMTNMFVIDDRNVDARNLEKISVDIRSLRREVECLSTIRRNKVDLVFIGCPHCSLDELKHVANFAKGKKISDHTECWVCTSHYIKEKGKRSVMQIEKAGAHVLTDMCTIVSWTELAKIKSLMTNSAKTAHYAPTMNKAEVILASLDKCLEDAFKG